MRLVSKILNRVNILTVIYRNDSDYSVHFTTVKKSRKEYITKSSDVLGSIEKAGNELKSCPTIVIIKGYGVVCKKIEPSHEILLKIKDPAGEFIWTESDGHICFVRSAQAKDIFQQLGLVRAKTFSVICSGEDAGDEDAAKRIAEAYFSELTFKNVLRPTAKGSVLAMSLVGKVKFYILGLLLILAASNAVLKPKARAEYEGLRLELEALNGKYGNDVSSSKRKKEIFAPFYNRPTVPISVICDRIAMLLPAEMALTEIVAYPLAKKLENGKMPEFRNGLLQLSGYAKNSSDISQYVMTLEKGFITSDINLAGVDYDKDSRLYSFKINIGL